MTTTHVMRLYHHLTNGKLLKLGEFLIVAKGKGNRPYNSLFNNDQLL